MDFKSIFTTAGTIILLVWYINGVACRKGSLEKCRCSEIQHTFVVDCANAGLESAPKGLPSRTTHLNLNNNKIQILNNDSFFVQGNGGLPNLTALSIRSNRLKKIGINAFRGLSELKMLDLYNNSLKFRNSCPKSVFMPISKSLEVLDIRQNLLGDISQVDYPVSVGGLAGLKELRIDCLRNKSLPKEYGKLKNLAEISFSGGRNKVRFVGDDMFKTISDLGTTDIDFAGLDIGVIGNKTFLHLVTLKTLDLSNNELIGYHIENIIPALKKTSIETLRLNNTGLSLGGRDLTKIFKKLGELHLKQLTLDNNTMETLKPIFSKSFSDLEVLSVGNTFLRDAVELRYDIFKMKHLIGLNVSWQVKYTEDSSTSLMNLSAEALNDRSSSNDICEPGVTCPLPWPPNIDWMDLSHSSIEAILLPEFVLLRNSTLTSLDMSYNSLRFIKKPIYCVKTSTSSIVPQVETMNFNNNALQCITSDFLKHCDWSSVKRMFLRNNKLGQAQGNVYNRDKNNILGFLKPAINLEVLDLAGNQVRNWKLLSDIESLTKLKRVDLSRNGFHNFSVRLQNLTELSKLNLTKNNIACLSVSTTSELNYLQVQKPGLEVDLSGNLLHCSWECFDFFQWIVETKVKLTDMGKYKCKFNDGRKECLYELDFIVTKLESQCFGTQWLKICLSVEMATCFLITAACVFYRRRYDMKYFFLKLKLNRHKLKKILDTQNYTYSAFISCDYRDAEFFVYRKFLPNLETPETKLRFCIAQRNFLVGTTILDNIMRAIHKSKKVIFIVSEYFLASKWCQEELMIAHQVSLIHFCPQCISLNPFSFIMIQASTLCDVNCLFE